METALKSKFEQNVGLRTFLKSTGQRLLIEARPTDLYWGAGLSLEDTDVWDQNKWKAKNKLGSLLMELRDKLYKLPCINCLSTVTLFGVKEIVYFKIFLV